MKLRAAFLFDNFGPYHIARVKAVCGVFDLLAIEFGASSSEYAWSRGTVEEFQRTVVNEAGASEEMANFDFSTRLNGILSGFKPRVVFVPGWASRGALLTLRWCVDNCVPAVVMSESTVWDESRNYFKEWIKRKIIMHFSAGLVGGSPHQVYLEQLGISPNIIFQGYDVVDNDYFLNKVDEVRGRKIEVSQLIGMPRNFFLASARFIEKKNLHRLIKAYASYRERSIKRDERCQDQSLEKTNDKSEDLWDLVLLGDGPLRGELEELRFRLGLEEVIHMPGFRNYEELPSYYAMAGGFLHPSTTDQWGLVVNEAMAAGLPVLVSNRCGCASNLVQEGGNGWTFDPADVDQLAFLMGKIASDVPLRSAMGAKSREIIKDWSLARFLKGATDAADTAIRTFRPRGNCFLNLVIWAISK